MTHICVIGWFKLFIIDGEELRQTTMENKGRPCDFCCDGEIVRDRYTFPRGLYHR